MEQSAKLLAMMSDNLSFQESLVIYNNIYEVVLRKLIPVNWTVANNIYDTSYARASHNLPWSCTGEEGLVMSSIILENGLTSGYEIATAFGISSLYIAGAFKKTKGLLTSLDCYIEEGLDDAQYTTEAIRTHIKNLRENEGGKLPDGLATARSNAYDTGCLEHVKYEIGVSPDDVDKFVNKKLDFVFIDGGHYGEQPMIDFTAVTKHIADKAVIVFHDCFEGSAVHNGCIAAEKYFGIKAIDMKTRWHLTVIPINIDMNFINAFLKTRI